ncbi:Peptidoglycan-N-acetylglucosamine deacetylase [compost metagenome]
MSVYQGKLLELLSINTEDHRSFLQVRLSSEQDVELRWHIDDVTAEGLRAVFEPDGIYKYRLSFHSLWDSSKQQYISYLTKTYRDQSDRIYFVCSEAYISGLMAIKNDETMPQIQYLSLSSDQQSSTPSLETEIALPRILKLKLKASWVAVALTSIIFIVLLGSIAPSYIYMSANGKSSKTASAGINSVGVHLVDKEVTSASPDQAEAVSSTQAADPVDLSEPMELSPSHSEFTDAFGHSKLTDTNVNNNESAIASEVLAEAVTYSIPKGRVALTFDDGPSKYTKDIVDILKEHEIGGTFFFVGKNVGHYSDSVKYVHNNGYSIGNHSMNHRNLVKLSNEKQEYEILDSNKLLEELIQEKVVLFRPPYGSKNAVTKEILIKNDKKMVLWNTDPEDWKSRDANAIYQSIAKSKVNGSIILLHESQATIDALPKIIKYLQSKQLEIVNLH